MSPREPDVEIAASARVAEMRLERKPRVETRAWADTAASAERTSERDNLPDELEPGVTYRNFSVSWRLAARLEDPDMRGPGPSR
jgi:hypothetical protein